MRSDLLSFFVFGLLFALLLVGGERLRSPKPQIAEPPPPQVKRFVYVPPPPRKATHLPADFNQWTKILASQHQEMQLLQQKLSTDQEIHLANRFDEFLQLDLSVLNPEQLGSLWHFADKGYFTIERRIILRLLEDRLRENDPHQDPAQGQDISQRAALLAKQNELKLRDLRTATELYESLNTKEFPLPDAVNQEQLAALLTLTSQKMDATRAELAQLDQQIETLKTQLNGGNP
jgi:hypothetical protein